MVAVTADPGTQFSASVGLGVTGLVGTLAVQIVAPGEREVPFARTTAGVSEFPAGSGVYGVELTAPLAPGLYQIVWDTAASGALSPSNTTVQPLTVIIQDPTFPGGWSWTPWGWGSGWDDTQFQVATASPGFNPVPTAATVRAASKLNFDELGYPAALDGTPGGLQEVVDRAEALFWRITGQELDAIDAKYAPLVRRVIQGLAEQMAMQSQEDVLSTQSDWDLIGSFSAGPYSEQHRDPGQMFRARMLNPVPWISDALWSLLSYERYSFYISFFSGQNVPAWTTTDVFWEDGLALGNLYGPAAGYWFGA